MYFKYIQEFFFLIGIFYSNYAICWTLRTSSICFCWTYYRLKLFSVTVPLRQILWYFGPILWIFFGKYSGIFFCKYGGILGKYSDILGNYIGILRNYRGIMGKFSGIFGKQSGILFISFMFLSEILASLNFIKN